jgi:type II secretory pathway pseudopilin PulG
MVILGLLAAAVAILVSGWSDHRDREISAAEIAEIEGARLGLRQTA